MRYPLLLLFLGCTSFAFCQAHLSIDLDEPAYLPEGSVDLGRKSVDTSAEVRELVAIYQTIRYPAAARTYGIMPSVRMIYGVDSMGMVQVGSRCRDCH